MARTVEPIEKERDGITVLLVALTSPDSWARMDSDAVPKGQVKFRRDQDKPGPLPVAVVFTVGEEGLGDLRGAKALLEHMDCRAFVAVEGQALEPVGRGIS